MDRQYTLSTHGLPIAQDMAALSFFYWWSVFTEERAKRQQQAASGAVAQSLHPSARQALQRQGASPVPPMMATRQSGSRRR